MGIRIFIYRKWAALRVKQVKKISARPIEAQQKTLQQLIAKARNTEFGRDHNFDSITTVKDFQREVPVRNYEQARKYFDRIVEGKPNISWPGVPLYLAKTSGTTSGAKYIPITKDIVSNLIGGARDGLLHFGQATGKNEFVEGKMLFLSGSPELVTNEYGMKIGRLSGITHLIIPSWIRKNRLPSFKTNVIEDWETKVDEVLEEAMQEDLRLMSGIPPWVQMFFERLEQKTGKLPLEQWPKLDGFIHGGVDFAPYRGIFARFFKENVPIWETYAASEGFFSFQDTLEDGMLLVTYRGIFFEFIPLEHFHDESPPRLTLGEVEIGKPYALILSSMAGLWAYDIGDVVKFVSLDPPRIKVSGRVKHFISAFGEHVIGEEVNRAMTAATNGQDCEVNEYTVAPFISREAGESFHEWLVEFARLPEDLAAFSQTLDEELRRQNAYYEDLRAGSMLKPVQVTPIEINGFRNYMKSIGKLGGQNKIPRLSNNRKIAEALHKYRKN